ncbi:MAG: imidazoleglycerol-phosphate dehydratase HisB [Coriobacteriaceae bacterium]|nr:imidazoleglycerol-phosphate dehydratase HisB [Coriobacteriaceae bacterium]
MARDTTIKRTTKETDIAITLDLDGTGETDIETGIGFFDHMLESFGRHGLFDLDINVKGDLHVDGHHTVEDTGIVLGQAFAKTVGNKRGIIRYGNITLPMDEALVLAAVDFSGRGALYWDMDVPYQMVGSFDSTLAKEFFIAFATNAGITLHVKQLAGENVHHIIEATFKAVARALRSAVRIDPAAPDALPSTKGAL